MKILFCGTPQFARTVLERIHCTFPADSLYILSAPARKQGRGMTLTQPPVAAYALEQNLPLYQPQTLKDGAFLCTLNEISPDVAVVAAYGKILPPYFISHPPLGCINVHASLLPEYRGASPIQRAIWDGRTQTGVTIMQMDDGLDTGDILLARSTEISEQDNTQTLTEALAALGADLICEALPLAQAGALTPRKQDDSRSSYAPKIAREDERLDFSLPAARLHAQIRALAPRPYANAVLPDGTELKICRAELTLRPALTRGTVSVEKSRVFVSCADYQLRLLTVKPQGRGEMDASSLVNGRRLSDGDVLA